MSAPPPENKSRKLSPSDPACQYSANVILQIKGNSGSGKTTLTRQFMQLGKRSKVITNWKAWGAGAEPRLSDYRVVIPGCQREWIVLGRYENTCGGCDTIKTYGEVIERVGFYSAEGYNVWLEGLMLSDTYGQVGEYSQRYGRDWLYFYLDTPLDVCLARVQQRRDADGNTKPFNPKKTTTRFRTIGFNKTRTEEHGHRVISLPLPGRAGDGHAIRGERRMTSIKVLSPKELSRAEILFAGSMTDAHVLQGQQAGP